jgi:hypothetical protein
MSHIDEKLEEIKELVKDYELESLRAKMENPDRVICPMNKRYWQVPLACTGYHYVCPHLDLTNVVCGHPEKRQWSVSYSGPYVKVLTR